MPPRKRTSSVGPKKSNQQPDTDSITLSGDDIADQDPASPPEYTVTYPEENITVEPKVPESDGVSQPVTELESDIKLENDGLDVISMESEGLKSGGGSDGGDDAKSENMNVDNGGSQLGIFAEQNSTEEETAAARINVAEASDDNLVVDEGHRGEREGEDIEGDDEDNEDSDEDNVDNGDSEDPDLFIPDPLSERMKHNDLIIHVGKLHKGAVEDDLINVFGKFGEIKYARIVRNSNTNKSSGFGFIRYATLEQAKNALTELKDGIEVNGKRVKISASQGSDTIYVGNICKTWQREHVLETLKSYGIEHIEELRLPDDPKNEGRIRGFAFLEFNTHADAMIAVHRLRKPDAVFGCDISAKVGFARPPMHPKEDVLSQVQTSMARPHFRGRFKVNEKSELSSPKKESERAIQAGSPTMTGHAKSNRAKRTRKAMAEEKGKSLSELKLVKGGKRNKPQSITEGQSVGAPSNMEKSKRQRKNLPSKVRGKSNKPQSITEARSVEAPYNMKNTNRKRKNKPSKVKNHGNGSIEHGHNRGPSKKLRGNGCGIQSDSFKKPKRDHHTGKWTDYNADSATYRIPYGPEYTGSTGYYQGQSQTYSASSASKRNYSDLEPHAGYLQPVAGKHGGPYPGYSAPAIGTQDRPNAKYFESASGRQHQPHAGYLEAAVQAPGQHYTRYFEPTAEIQSQNYGLYLEPAVRTQGQLPSGYLQPTVGVHGHHLYDSGLRRDVEHDGQGSRASAFGGGSAVPPDYTYPSYTSYAGYQGGANADVYHQSSGPLLTRRAYH